MSVLYVVVSEVSIVSRVSTVNYVSFLSNFNIVCNR